MKKQLSFRYIRKNLSLLMAVVMTVTSITFAKPVTALADENASEISISNF